MKTYNMYIENRKSGIEHMSQKLGSVLADNLIQAYDKARDKFKTDIYGFQTVYGMDSRLFHDIKKERKYRVWIQGNSVFVCNNRTGNYMQHHITEFIYGQLGYNEKTEKYPNYVHGEVWSLAEKR